MIGIILVAALGIQDAEARKGHHHHHARPHVHHRHAKPPPRSVNYKWVWIPGKWTMRAGKRVWIWGKWDLRPVQPAHHSHQRCRH